jgi:hypothetical protein
MSSQYCLYVPIISTTYLEDDIKRIFDADIGKVTRVDFAPAKSKPGQLNTVPAIIRSAYVYISCFYRTRLAANIRSTLYGLNRGFRFVLTSREYWVLLKNRNPIPTCEQNIHQLAERLRKAESFARFQQKTIDSLQNSLIAQMSYSDRMLETVVELLKNTSDGPFPDMANVYSQYNHVRFNKRYDKRWLLSHDDDGDTINLARRNASEIEDDYTINEARRTDGDDFDSSTINSELINDTEYSDYSYSNFWSLGKSTIPEEMRDYIQDDVRPEIYGRTVEEYTHNYA